LLSEAVSLNFWPKIKILNPTNIKGQVYLPFVNWLLLIMCSIVVILFKESSNMEAAYGLAITITMIMTTLLLSYYLYQKGTRKEYIFLILFVFLTIEGNFLIANLHKFAYGGWFTLMLASLYFLVMFGWYFGRKIKNRRITFSRIDNYTQAFIDLKNDDTVAKYATNLAYIIKANNYDQVESKVIYSIFNRSKRADCYWLLHVDMVDDPDRFEYEVRHIIPGTLIRIDFHLGFKVDPKINLYFREVLDDLVKSEEVQLESGYDSLRKHGMQADFRFVMIERIMLPDFKLSNLENITLILRRLVRHIGIPDERALQLDSANTIVEKVPIIVNQPIQTRIKPVQKNDL
jgi:KUP system potassium uptake protein